MVFLNIKKIISIIPFLIFLVIFRNWFLNHEIIGGDWPYFFKEFLEEFTFLPPSWASYQGLGLGGQVISYALDSHLYFVISIFVNILQIPWWIVYKIFFFGLFIFLSIFSSTYLLKAVLPEVGNRFPFTFLTAFIYTANTYILMIVGGGQMGMALAYSIAPLVLARFIRIIQNSEFPLRKASRIQDSLVAGLVLASQMMFDLRIAYLSMITVTIYAVLNMTYYVVSSRDMKKNILNTLYLILYTFAIPIGIAILLHASWLLPIFISRTTPLDNLITSHSSSAGFKFFSFANFSQAVSILHPNWPENIFGKTYFMKTEFIVLPLIAYSSLLFINLFRVSKLKNFRKAQIQNPLIIFFVLLGLIGTFLAKGANPPFGEVNIWLFEHVPGFSLLRDPTKFYLLTILAYLALIPYGISGIFNWLKLKLKSGVYSILSNIFLISAFLYFGWLIHPALFGELKGTFQIKKIPQEYLNLKNFLHKQEEFFRTLWIPRQQRFSYYSNLHPSVEAMSLFSKGNKFAFAYATNSAEIIDQFKKQEAKEYLQSLSIKYVIVPHDALGEIFLRDRKYDEDQYKEIILQLDGVDWLRKLNNFGKIAVYEIANPKGHFWQKGESMISFTQHNTFEYFVVFNNNQGNQLIFSEAYSPYWIAKVNGLTIQAEKTSEGLNAFKMPEKGNYPVKIYFRLNDYYQAGRIITLATLVLLLVSLFILKQKVKKL